MNIFQSLLLLEGADSFVNKYKVLYDGQSDGRIKYIKQALEMLETAMGADTVFNVDFGEIKSQLTRALEDSLKVKDDFSRLKNDGSLSDAEWRKSPHMQVYMAGIQSYVNLSQAKGQAQKIKDFLKSKPADFPKEDIDRLETMLAVNEAGNEIFQMIKTLKPKIVKGRKPNPNADPNAFQSKLGSKESQDLVKEKLKDGIKKPLDEYEKAIKSMVQGVIDNFAKQSRIVVERRNGILDPLDQHVFQQCFDYKTNRDKNTIEYSEIKPNDRAKTFAAASAKQQREGIEQRYFSKNIKKLSHVVDLKGNLSKIEELPYRAPTINGSTGRLESGFKFLFADGSEFKVINKIVTKHSYAGTRFEQFPTTFHDVKLPDGSKMKLPSEEKIVREFGEWKPK